MAAPSELWRRLVACALARRPMRMGGNGWFTSLRPRFTRERKDPALPNKRLKVIREAARPMARPTPYLELNSVLEDLVTSVKGALGEAFVSACLQGSFAVGDFDRHSDVDFVIVVAHELSDGQVDALQAIHRRIYGGLLAGRDRKSTRLNSSH